MDQSAPAETRPNTMSLRKIASRIAVALGLMLMLVWSIVLPVLGILYLAERI
jgi:hypothetical protein